MSNPEQRLATGVLVIGTGGSGLRAAIELALTATHADQVNRDLLPFLHGWERVR